MIEGIKLIDFLTLFDFTYYDEENHDNNTDIVRIYYDDTTKSKWFEIGVYDWGGFNFKIEILKDVLSDKILNMYVYSFTYDDDIRVLKIFCQKEKEIED